VTNRWKSKQIKNGDSILFSPGRTFFLGKINNQRIKKKGGLCKVIIVSFTLDPGPDFEEYNGLCCWWEGNMQPSPPPKK
jgi:hypothetical protein